MFKVSLFGYFVIQASEQPIQQKTSKSIIALLAYLVINRARPHLREALADVFWSDASREHSRKCLNTTLWRLRRMLEELGLPEKNVLRSTPDGGIYLDHQFPHWFDVEVFEQSITEVLHTPLERVSEAQINRVQLAAGLYKGDLLEGFYAGWVLRERERLRGLYLNGLQYIMRYFVARRQYELGIDYGQRLLGIDPLREDIHRSLMQLYANVGLRSQVMQQYERCCHFLLDELGVEPMIETRHLYTSLMNGEADGATVAGQKAEPANLEQEMFRLRSAIDRLSQVQAGLQQTLDLLEKRYADARRKPEASQSADL